MEIVMKKPFIAAALICMSAYAAAHGCPGERFHVHYIDKDMTVSGHVDQYTVRVGADLWLATK
jgi:alpha-acetolactate decarboxylase